MSTKKAELGLGGPKKKGKPSFDTRAVPSTQDAGGGPMKKRAELGLGGPSSGPKTKEIFLTSGGAELSLRPISPLLRDKVLAGVDWPEKPMYQAETVSGEIEEHPHDETTLQTDEDKAAWREYLVAMARAQSEANARVAEMLFQRGIDYEAIELPEDEGWIQAQEELGITVPGDPLKRKRHYMETELLTSNDELKMLTLRLMAMSGTDEEVIAQVERIFRGQVEGPPAGEPENLEGAVELRDGIPESEDGEGVGEES